MNQREPNRFFKLLKQAWPFIYRAINSTLYFVISIIKTFVRQAVSMIKTGGIGE